MELIVPMKMRPTLFAGFRWRWFLAAIALAFITITDLRAADLSGTYENFGSMVNPATDAEAGTISLQGLFSQEFDYKLTRAQHAYVDQVVVKQTSDQITIECRDTDGKLTWGGHWKRDAGYNAKDGQVDLIVRSKRNKDDSYLFSFSTVSDQHLLVVTVNLMQATVFGPVAKPLGTFLFSPRLASSAES